MCSEPFEDPDDDLNYDPFEREDEDIEPIEEFDDGFHGDELEFPDYAGVLVLDDDLIYDAPDQIFDSDIYLDDCGDSSGFDAYGGEPPVGF